MSTRHHQPAFGVDWRAGPLGPGVSTFFASSLLCFKGSREALFGTQYPPLTACVGLNAIWRCVVLVCGGASITATCRYMLHACVRLPSHAQAVKEDWYFQMYYDDLPVWGFIGKMEKLFKPGGVTEFKYFLFTHIDFDVKYNDDHVIEINVSTDPLASRPHRARASPAQATRACMLQRAAIRDLAAPRCARMDAAHILPVECMRLRQAPIAGLVASGVPPAKPCTVSCTCAGGGGHQRERDQRGGQVHVLGALDTGHHPL